MSQDFVLWLVRLACPVPIATRLLIPSIYGSYDRPALRNMGQGTTCVRSWYDDQRGAAIASSGGVSFVRLTGAERVKCKAKDVDLSSWAPYI